MGWTLSTVMQGRLAAQSGLGQAVLALCACALMSGCASELRVVSSKGNDPIPHAGAPYNLTFTQFRITVHRRLADCRPGRTSQDPVTLDVVTQFKIDSREARDPAREYVIDFLALRSFMKTTDLRIEYHPNGALKTVNASADDVTGSLVGAVASAVARFAVSQVPVLKTLAEMDTFSELPGPCPGHLKPEVSDALLRRDDLTREVEQLAKDVERSRAEVEHLVTVGKVQGRVWSEAERVQMTAALQRIQELVRRLNPLRTELNDLLALLTISSELAWPSDGDLRSGMIPRPGDGTLGKWIRPGATHLPLADHFLYLRSDSRLQPTGKCPPSGCQEPPEAGLRFRIPVPGELLICSGAECMPDGSGGQVVVRHEAMLSQLGRVFALPLRNYPFMKQNLVATFSEAGQPLSLGYMSDALAARAGDSLAGLVDQVVKVRDARKPRSELEQLKEETELLQARAAREAARRALETPKAQDQAAVAQAFQPDAAGVAAAVTSLRTQSTITAARSELEPRR